MRRNRGGLPNLRAITIVALGGLLAGVMGSLMST
jgi:hypothetical protein